MTLSLTRSRSLSDTFSAIKRKFIKKKNAHNNTTQSNQIKPSQAKPLLYDTLRHQPTNQTDPATLYINATCLTLWLQT